jgi:drug/metabolite transporter (DMT)-like permease
MTILCAAGWGLLLYAVRLLSLFFAPGRGRERLPDEGEALPPAKEDGDRAPAPATEPKACCTINPAMAAVILVGIAVFKTLITKVLFAEMDTPVAYSILSCLVTNMGISLWFAAVPGSLKFLSRDMVPTFAAVCIAIAIDLGCSNVAISLLSVALQQVLRAAAPAATMLIEVVIKRKPQKPLMVLAVICVSAGPVLTQLGSSIDGSVVGVAMQLAAVFGSASKSVFGHAILTQHKKKLGLLSFLFWAEWFTAAMLLPWATLNGELADMWYTQRPVSDWAILYFTASVGGIRIWSQMLFLQQTSATSLAISSIAVTALTSSLSILIFHTPTTPLLIAGIVETVLATSWYTYLKLKAKKEAGDGKH